MSYTYTTTERVKVPGHKSSEPAIQKLFEAIRIRDEREKTFNPDSLTDDNRKEYIDSITEEIKVRSQGFKFQIYEMGGLLCEAKKILPHGQFQTWIDKNFEFGRRTAYNFMKVYWACMGHPEVVNYFKPLCLYVITAPDFPRDLREALFNGAKGPVDIKKKDVVKLALDYKNGKISTENEEVQKLLKKERNISLWKKYIIELEALKVLITNRLGRIERLPSIHSFNPLIEDYTVEEQLTRAEEQEKIEDKIRNFRAVLTLTIEELDKKCK